MSKTNIDLTDVPRGWVWTTLQEMCLAPQYGWTTKASPHDEYIGDALLAELWGDEDE